MTVHLDWYQNDRGQQVLAVEDDASRRVFDMIETDRSSASQAVELLESVDEEFDSPVPILEVITDHGSEFVNPRQEKRPIPLNTTIESPEGTGDQQSKT